MVSARCLRAANRARRLAFPLALLAGAPELGAQTTATVPRGQATRATGDRVSPTLLARVRAEAMERSQVMELTSWLTDVHGPRLTGSPQARAAAEWATKTMQGWGLQNVKLEPWGPFGRGWSNERFALSVTAPRRYPVIAYPSAWTPGTNGTIAAQAVLVQIDSEPDLARYAGQLRGKFVLLGRPRDVPARFEPQARRYADAQLDSMAALPISEPRTPTTVAQMLAQLAPAVRQEREFAPRRSKFLIDEGAAAVLVQGRGDDGTVFVSATGGAREANAGPLVATAVLAAEHYGRIARTLEKKVPVTLELTAQNTFYDADLNSFNIVAELPGTDRRLKDEVVMLGAHFDSWHAATGATDNAAGAAVMMEAMRILKAAGVPLKRTVRIALWTGEEQGLLGSRAYVGEHFGDRETMRMKPAHAAFSSYFNLDNGTGKIRGVYAQGNAAVAPIFEAWMAPFNGEGMRTVTLANTTGTDHLAFDAVGLPGFQFIQDPVEYDTRTHHSNMDVYERVQPDDMKWNAMVVATFVMQAANREGKLPRKVLPGAAGARAAR